MTLFHDWQEEIKPLLKKYKGKKHPLDYKNLYQVVIMVILSAQDSDANINKIAPLLFENFPNMESLAVSNVESLMQYITKVRNYVTKANWIIEIARTLKTDDNIPKSMEQLLVLKGIGRKSANVIIREAGINAQGILVDLHVIRVAPRIGLASESNDGNKIEKQLMQIFTQDIWGEIGMAISFLGREICRPTNPKCGDCPVSAVCFYYNSKAK
ncbi:endonuclease III [Flavobacterium sp.]|uniref:endonuclease III domain-containing protein n=1 Tax=Flavobacterium sp. TaxID=239 RepID=UPI00286B1438|nr:endonuclease III [Flavobacterium sp.]